MATPTIADILGATQAAKKEYVEYNYKFVVLTKEGNVLFSASVPKEKFINGVSYALTEEQAQEFVEAGVNTKLYTVQVKQSDSAEATKTTSVADLLKSM